MVNRTEPINVTASLIFIFASMALFGFVLAVIFYYQYAQNKLATSTAPASSPDALRVIRSTEEEYLTKYEHVDKDKGVVRIPIERAMALEATAPWRLDPPDIPAIEPPAIEPPAADSATTETQAADGSTTETEAADGATTGTEATDGATTSSTAPPDAQANPAENDPPGE